MKWEMASVSPADTLSIVRLSTGGQFALMLDIAGSLNPRNKCMKYFMLIIFYLEPVEQGHWPIRMAAWKTNPRSLPAWWGRPFGSRIWVHSRGSWSRVGHGFVGVGQRLLTDVWKRFNGLLSSMAIHLCAGQISSQSRQYL